MEGTLRRRIGKGCVVAAAAALTAGILPSPGSFVVARPRPVEPPSCAGPRLHHAVLRANDLTLTPGAEAPRFHLLLTGDPDPEALRALGITLHTRAGDVWTADAPLSAVEGLGSVPGLNSVEIAARLNPLLDVALEETGVAAVRSPSGDAWSGPSGRGVLVGIVDTGVDVTHADFQNPDGSTRIVGYWDQASDTGLPPLLPGFAYGSYWTAEQIDAGAALPGDPSGHGTHVASVAAGNGRAGNEAPRFAGVAPEADIAVVATTGFEDDAIDAVAFLFSLAAARGEPCVVNLSLGTHLGSHDGRGALETSLDALAGPGRLITAAAGNDGGHGIHAALAPPPGAADSARVVVSTSPGADAFVFFDIEAWYSGGSGLEVTVVTPSGARFGPYLPGDLEPDRLTGEGTLFLHHADQASGDDRRQVFLEISNTVPAGGGGAATPPAPGTWRIVAANPGSEPCILDLWVAAAYPPGMVTASWYPDDVDPSAEVAIPGTAHRVITVGAYNTRRCWDAAAGNRCSTLPEAVTEPGAISWFSSAGPTRDGRQKPEVSAPGFVVAAARSHQIDTEVATALGLPDTGEADGEHMMRAGTSVSAPLVAGVLALALESRPGLDPESAREELVAAARQDVWTGSGWNPRSGFGKIDASAFLAVVPVNERNWTLTTTGSGLPEIAWSTPVGDAVAGFAIFRRTPPAAWSFRARLDGPGPHRWVDDEASGPAVYRVDAVRRDGRTESWGEQAWTPAPGPGLSASPNPFRAGARLAVNGAAGSLRVRDASGRVVRSWAAPGAVVAWDGRDERGVPVAAGVYWVEAEAGGVRRAVRLVRLP